MVPSNFLLDFVANLLAALFLTDAGSDPAFARAAARQTITEYQAATGTELLLVAQIVAFSIASINAAVQSTQDDILPSLARRLQTTANSLSRSADRARQALTASRRHQPATPDPIPASASEPEAPGTQPPKTRPRASQSAAPQPRQVKPGQGAPDAISPSVWADSFKDLAQEVAASLVGLSPRERQIADIQIAALQDAARSLHTAPALLAPGIPAPGRPGPGLPAPGLPPTVGLTRATPEAASAHKT